MTASGLHDLLVAASGGACKVWPLEPGGGEDLTITYMLAGGSSDLTFDGPAMQRRRVQVDVRSDVAYLVASGLRDRLIAYLNDWSGTLTDGTFVQLVEFIQPMDSLENDARRFRLACEFYFYFT